MLGLLIFLIVVYILIILLVSNKKTYRLSPRLIYYHSNLSPHCRRFNKDWYRIKEDLTDVKCEEIVKDTEQPVIELVNRKGNIIEYLGPKNHCYIMDFVHKYY